MNATAEITTATVSDERCKHGQIASIPCKKCSHAAAQRAARAANKTAVVAEPVAIAPAESAPVVEVAPVVEAAATEAKPKLDFVGAVAQIYNVNGLVSTMDAGPKASSECRHLELDTLLAHVAVPVGTSDEAIAALLAARAEKMMARPKIQRLIAAKAKA
jgi:hypothetical protein